MIDLYFASEALLKRLNYVKTSEPDRVAEELHQQDQQIKFAVEKFKELQSWVLQYGKNINKKIDLMIKELKGETK